jgi:hypothetical protein
MGTVTAERGIVFIDMHLRDERVLERLKACYADRPFRISHEKIADEFKCHRLTARAIMHRLASAGHIKVIDRRAKCGGYVYKIAS